VHAHAHATSSEAVSKRACKCVDARRTQKCERALACKECWSEGESTAGAQARASKTEGARANAHAQRVIQTWDQQYRVAKTHRML